METLDLQGVFMPDYLPRSDGEFDAWQTNLMSYVSAHLADLGLQAADVTPLTAAQTVWSSVRSAHVAAQAAAESARQNKDDGRSAYEALIRPLVRRLQASPAVDDGERQAMGLTVADRTPTAVGPPLSRPVATVDASERLRHTIRFADEAAPTSRAKPAGVLGCEVWVKIGAGPTDPSELTFLGLDTRSPYVAEFDGVHAGQIAHYMLRWVNGHGEKGPWSQTVSATIGA